MTRELRFAFLALTLAITAAPQAATPKRLSRAIELLELGWPIYYPGSRSGTEGGIERGNKSGDEVDPIVADCAHRKLRSV